MNKIISPYNLAEQVICNTKNILELISQVEKNTKNIDDILELIGNVPDLSLYYTKEEADAQFLKIEEENLENKQKGTFYYSEQTSPTISKIDANGNGTQFRLLTNSIAINFLNAGNLEHFLPADDADVVNKKYLDEEIFGVNEEITKIENGEIDFSSLTLNGETIETWPDGGGGTSSETIDDSETKPTEGINPWKTQIDTNTNNISTNNTNITNNTNDIANIEEEITNITNGTTTIPQTTDNVTYTILGNTTTQAFGNFNAANPRLYGTNSNDTVVRDNTILSITDNLQNEIDIINGDGSGTQAIIDDLLPNQEASIGDFDTNFSLKDYSLLFAGEQQENGTIGEGLINGLDIEFSQNYLNAYNYQNQDIEFYFTPNEETNFSSSTTNSYFTGTTYLKGYNNPITPLLTQEGLYGDGEEITLEQSMNSFDFLIVKANRPNRDIYMFVDKTLTFPEHLALVDGSDGTETRLSFVDETTLKVVISLGSDNFVKNIWGLNFFSQTELKDQTFNPLDYDLLIITYAVGGDFPAYETGQFLTKNLVLDDTTVHSFTHINTAHTIKFKETGYTEITPIVSIKGILFEERTESDCRAKASVCDLNALKEEIEENTNSIITLNNLIQESFETHGVYTSPQGTATNETIRPILTAQTPLDPEYVEVAVDPNPNQFTNLKDGKIIFSLFFSNLTNLSETESATLTLNIYINNILVASPSGTRDPNWSGSFPIEGALTVAAGDVVYAEFVVQGSLSVDAPIQYTINYKSADIIASPSSNILNDKIENPNLGINADLNQISTNTTNITTKANQTDLDALAARVAAIENSYMLPIGTIVISTNSPTYGVWEDLGLLEEGQAIIGGSSSEGQVASHNHIWATESDWYDAGNNGSTKRVVTWLKDATGKSIGSTDGSIEGPYQTNAAGASTPNGPRNSAYGLGIGTSNHLWKRTS